MELILISDSKLKIMLTTDDMREYALDCSTLDYDNTETRRAFWSILDEAKHRTGFDAASEKVFVQVYPSRSGGCEMYVTKLGLFSESDFGEADASEDDVRIRAPHRERLRGGSGILRNSYSETGRTAYIKGRESAYRFTSLEQLLGACRRLASLFRGKSSAYTDGRNYYLLLKEKNSAASDIARVRGSRIILPEYAEEVDADALSIFVCEHGSCLRRDDAIEVLGKC